MCRLETGGDSYTYSTLSFHAPDTRTVITWCNITVMSPAKTPNALHRFMWWLFFGVKVRKVNETA